MPLLFGREMEDLHTRVPAGEDGGKRAQDGTSWFEVALDDLDVGSPNHCCNAVCRGDET